MTSKNPPNIPEEVSEYLTVKQDLDLHISPEDEYEGDMESANIVFEWTSDMEDNQYKYSPERTVFEPITVTDDERQEVIENIRKEYVEAGYPISTLPWQE